MVISLSNYRFFFVFDGWFFFFIYDPRFVFSFLSPKMVWTAIRSGSLRETTKSVRFSFWNLVFIGFVFDRRRSDGIVELKKKIDSARFCFTLSLGDAVRREWFAKKKWIFGQWFAKKMDFWPMRIDDTYDWYLLKMMK